MRRLRTLRCYALLLGLFAGIAVLTGCHLFLATFGTGLPAVTALAFAIAAGVELGWKPPRGTTAPRAVELKRHAWLQLALAAWLVILPWGMQLALSAAARIPLEVMAAPGRAVIFQCVAAVVLLTPGLFLLTRFPLNLHHLASHAVENEAAGKPADNPAEQQPAEDLTQTFLLFRPFVRLRARCRFALANRIPTPLKRALLPRFLIGVVAGLMLDVLLLAPLMGVHNAGLSVALGATIAFLASLRAASRQELRRSEIQSERTAASAKPPLTTHHSPLDNHLRPPTSDQRRAESRAARLSAGLRRRSAGLSPGTAVAVIGALTAVLLRMTHQLAATAEYLVFLQWTVLILGATFGLRRSLRGDDRQGAGRAAGGLWVAGAAAATLLLYSWLVDVSLWTNAFVVAPWMLMLSRCLLLALLLAPVGYGWGRIVAAGSSTGRREAGMASISGFQAFAFAAGFLLVRWFAFRAWSPADLLVGLSLAMLVMSLAVTLPAVVSGFRSLRIRDRRQLLRISATAAPAVLVALSPLFRANYDPATAARRLFATNVFVARMNGTDPALLSALDEGRAVALRESDRGTLSLWRYRGTQLQIRENGVPKAIVSTRPRMCPHFSAEVMPAVLPLVLHQQPRSVLILGISGGVSLTTALSFPVESVTLLEGDGRLIELLRERVWSESREAPENDARLRLVPLEPALGVACAGTRYDVIVSTPDQSALLRSTPYFTRGFYRRVSRRLQRDGIFCQRFSQVDYGPRPLESAARTLQSVFRDVAAIEVAPGELALLATNSPQGLVRDGLVRRFQAGHVRTVLSRIGWDWSLPLNLKAFGHEDLRAVAESAPANTAANGSFAFRLPQELMRWAPKWQELSAVLASRGSRFLESEGVDGNDPELLRRLSELEGQRRLMTRFPDQWWAYRKTLKQQVHDRPRTLIARDRSGRAAKQIHPEDRRRMRYFRDLDRAARNPTPERIRRLADYAEPYDPLLSYFAHCEIAALYERSAPRDVRAEAWHRLHAIYYADPRDRSVRDVAKALQLLARHPNAAGRPLDRWDHLDALLQVLRTRWQTRGLAVPKSAQVVLVDVEESIEAAEAAFQAMQALRPEAGIDASHWEARRRVVERGLLRPLRTYRSRLLRYHHLERRKLRELLKKMEDDRRREVEEGRKQAPSPKANSPKPAIRPVAN